ncbi:MAG: MerC domain-containing protein [Planctomycetota bacterium]
MPDTPANIAAPNAGPVLDAAAIAETASWADLAGMTASIGCAIHCAAMPLVIGYLPMLGLGWLAGEGFHQAMAILCFALAAAAFVPGWRKHGRFAPAIAGLAGVALLTGAAFGAAGDCCPSPDDSASAVTCDLADCEVCAATVQERAEVGADGSGSPSADAPTGLLATVAPWLTPLGGLILVGAHVSNHRFAGACCRGGESCAVTPEETAGSTDATKACCGAA